MSWRISVKHVSEYIYKSEVTASYNEARMTPVSSPTQTVIESDLKVIPSIATYKYFDYWGTLVNAFDIHEPHKSLKMTSSSKVETSPSRPLDETIAWSDIVNPKVSDELSEYLQSTPYANEISGLRELTKSLSDISCVSNAVIEGCKIIRDRITYQPGSTSVSGTASDAWKQGSGVCQDFAHISLALFRHLDIPSRYVSGYLFPVEEADVGDLVVGASHAWIELWLGNWYPLDPTNGAPVGERYIKVGHGRDYEDVPPFTGIYNGGSLESLNVSVELIRLA